MPSSHSFTLRPIGLFLLTVTLAALPWACHNAVANDTELASFRLDASEHPLKWTLRYARSRADYIRENVRDYSCRLIKRERIDGKLQPHQFAQVKVRCDRRAGVDDAKPLSDEVMAAVEAAKEGIINGTIDTLPDN